MLGEGSAAPCSSGVGAFPAEQAGDNRPAMRDPSFPPSFPPCFPQDRSPALLQQEKRSYPAKLLNCSERVTTAPTCVWVAPELGSLSVKSGETLCPILVLGAEEAPACTLNLGLAQHFKENGLFRTIPATSFWCCSEWSCRKGSSGASSAA